MSQSFTIALQTSDNSGQSWSFTEGEVVLGADAGCDVIVSGAGVNGRHALLLLHTEKLEVEDLGAETEVNGYPISGRVEIPYPATLTLGTVSLSVDRTIEPHETSGNDLTPESAATVIGEKQPVTWRTSLTGTAEHQGAYALLKEIARGGMGQIYEGTDSQLKRQVAVKISSVSRGGEDLRFVKEAEVLAHLAHPNIVPVYNLGTDNQGRPFYSMKLVKGRSLQAILRLLKKGDAETQREFTRGKLLSIFGKVCDAMSFAHSKGILHRDLKPDNIMVGEFGEVLVMDWGLAKVMGAAETLSEQEAPVTRDYGMTMEGEVMGTPQYMSPEQAEGMVSELDERSDIYSLGGVLYALLTLRPPVEGTSLDEILSKVKSGEISSMSTSRGKAVRAGKGETVPEMGEAVPQVLQAVTLKAMGRDRTKRYQNVGELAADIESYLQGFATRAEGAGIIRQIVLLVNRHRGIAAMLGILLLAGGVFTIKLLASEHTAREQRSIAEEQRNLAEQKANDAQEQKKLAEAKAKEAEQHRGLAELAGQKLAGSQLTETEQRQLAEKKALEAEQQRSLAQANEEKAIENAKLALTNQRKAETNESIALTEKEAARREAARAQLVIAEALEKDFDGEAMASSLAKVPEDLRDQTWEYIHHKLDTAQRSINSPGNKAFVFVMPIPQSPHLFLTVLSDGLIQTLNAETGETQNLFTLDATYEPPIFAAISPDRQTIAITAEGKQSVEILQLPMGQKTLSLPFSNHKGLSFSSDGKLLFLLSQKWTPRAMQYFDVRNVKTGASIYNSPSNDNSYGGFTSDSKAIRAISLQSGIIDINTNNFKIDRQKSIPITNFQFTDNNFYSTADSSWTSLFLAHKSRSLTGLDLINGVVLFEKETSIGRCKGVCHGNGMILTASQRSEGCLTLQFRNDKDGGLIKSAFFLGKGGQTTISIHPVTGEAVATVGGRLKVYNSAVPIPERRIEGLMVPVFFGESWNIVRLAVRDGQGESKDERVELVDIRDAALSKKTYIGKVEYSSPRMSVSSDGSRLAFHGVFFKTIHSFRWNGNSLVKASQWDVPFGPGVLELSPNGDRVFAGGGVYETSSGNLQCQLDRTGIGSAQGLIQAGWIDAHRILQIVMAGEENSAGSEKKKAIALWDADSGKRLLHVIVPDANVFCVSPDGKWIAEGGKEKRIRIRNAETLNLEQAFRAHDGEIVSIVWHPKLPLLLSGAEDQSVKIWDTRNGALVEKLEGVGVPLRLLLSPDGKTIGVGTSFNQSYWGANVRAMDFYKPASLSGTGVRP